MRDAEPKRGRPPKFSDTGARIKQCTYRLFEDQIAYVSEHGGSELLRELIDKRRGRQLIRGTK